MKKPFLTALILMTVLCYSQVGINTENPDSSSALDIESTSGGLLIPRLTETQRDAISSPATGLMIYQIDQAAGFYFFNGSVWAKIGGAEEQDTLTDPDGNTASTSNIGPAIWMTENVKIVTYRDGTPIPEVTDNNEWSNLTTGAWCYLSNDPNNNYLGKLYNWYALMGIHDNDPNTPDKEFAPPGWQVPTRADFALMEQYYITLGHNHEYPDNDVSNIYTSAFEQKIAKAISSQSGWLINNDLTVGTPGHDQYLNNSTGFNLSPDTGQRRWGDGVFYVTHTNAYLWTKSLKIFNVNTNSVGNVHIYDVYYKRDFTILSDTNPKAGLPVRLIRY